MGHAIQEIEAVDCISAEGPTEGETQEVSRHVTVEVSNANEIRLKIAAELPIAQWREILSRVNHSEVKYYGPLYDLLEAIQRGVTAIERREDVAFPPEVGTA